MNLNNMTQDELMALAELCDYEGDENHCLACEAWSLWVGRNAAASEDAEPNENDFRVIARDGGGFAFMDTRTNKVLLFTKNVGLDTLNRLFREAIE